MSVRVFGTTFIVINDVEIATDLLTRQGSNFIDRPSSMMADMGDFNHFVPIERDLQRFACLDNVTYQYSQLYLQMADVPSNDASCSWYAFGRSEFPSYCRTPRDAST